MWKRLGGDKDVMADVCVCLCLGGYGDRGILEIGLGEDGALRWIGGGVLWLLLGGEWIGYWGLRFGWIRE